MFSAFFLLLVLSSPSAVLGLDLLACSGSVVVSYNPPLSNELQAVTATQTINFTSCLDIPDLQITAGWIKRMFHVNTSCSLMNVSTPELSPATLNFTWVTSGTPYSTIYFLTGSSVIIDGTSQTIRNDGNVTSGALMGGNATLSFTIAQPNITACDQGDMETVTGVATLEIIDLCI